MPLIAINVQRLPMDDAIRAGEQRFRALVAACGGIFYQMSADWSEMQALDGRGLVASNDAPLRDWLQQNVPEFEHAAVRERIAHSIRHKSVFELEHRVYRPDRTLGWTHSRAVPVLDESGRIAAWIGSATDITDRKTSEEQLRRSHDTFSELIQHDPFGVYVVDADFRLRQVSLGAQEVFAHVPRPLFGRDFAEVLRAVWAEPFATEAIAKFRHTLNSGEPYASPRTVERRQDSGDVEAYDWRIERITVPDGRFGVVCYFYDLSERQRWEAALRESGLRNAAVLHTAIDCIVSMDHQGRVVEWNPAAEGTFGYGRAEAVGREMAELIVPPAMRDAHRVGLANYLVTGDGPAIGKRFEITAVRRDGVEFPVELSITRMPGDGPPTFIGYLRDISDRKLAEAALAESEAKFRLLAETIPQLAWMARPDGHIFWYNRRWYEYTGTTPEQMDGWGWQRVHDPARLPDVLELWKASLSTGDPFEMEFPLRGADGTYRPFLTRVAPLRDDGGTVIQWFGTNTDVAEHRRAVEAERAARADAERESRMKDDFLATLSHELRTPLNAILGWSQILSGGPREEKDLIEGLRTIERNARAQTQIIEDLLDMSRIISGKLRLDVQRVDLASVVRAAVDTVMPTATTKSVRLQVVLDPVAAAVSGDPARLQQVFWNLLTNAVKFTSKGGRVQVLLERVNSHLEVSITDTGEGISPEFLPFVFDRFRQSDASTTRRHGGLGLGLSIVKQLVELHGGQVHAKSGGLGQGATFTVMLPLAIVIHPKPESPSERLHPATRRELVLSDTCDEVAGLRVLVVDDEPDGRALLKRLLEDCNAVVLVAASASEALGLVKNERPDVLVSDIGMPGEDGYELIRRVRALGREAGGDTPAVALTAYARAEDRVRAVRAGYQHHVAKPVEPAELIAMIASLAKRRK